MATQGKYPEWCQAGYRIAYWRIHAIHQGDCPPKQKLQDQGLASHPEFQRQVPYQTGWDSRKWPGP